MPKIQKKLLSLIPKRDSEGKFTSEFRIDLLKARLDATQGHFVSHQDLKKRLKL
jgi:hypothetical protein